MQIILMAFTSLIVAFIWIKTLSFSNFFVEQKITKILKKASEKQSMYKESSSKRS